MVDLRAKPYCLGDEEIAWVESTIASMTDEEKVGQLWQYRSAVMPDAELNFSTLFACMNFSQKNAQTLYKRRAER